MDKDDVLRFDVSMQDFVFMHLLNGIQEVAYDERSRLLGEGGAV